jgi:hypothetical protein
MLLEEVAKYRSLLLFSSRHPARNELKQSKKEKEMQEKVITHFLQLIHSASESHDDSDGGGVVLT